MDSLTVTNNDHYYGCVWLKKKKFTQVKNSKSLLLSTAKIKLTWNVPRTCVQTSLRSFNPFLKASTAVTSEIQSTHIRHNYCCVWDYQQGVYQCEDLFNWEINLPNMGFCNRPVSKWKTWHETKSGIASSLTTLISCLSPLSWSWDLFFVILFPVFGSCNRIQFARFLVFSIGCS